MTKENNQLIFSSQNCFSRAPMYRQTHQSNTPLGSSPGVLQQDLTYAQSDMYRRPTVFVSQAPYQNYNRVVPPPAHNGSNRQVNYCCYNFFLNQFN